MITTEYERPLLSDQQHPIETGRYLLATEEINRMCEEIYIWLDNRAPGGIIYGKPRMGKTRATQYLIQELSTTATRMKFPVFYMTARQYKIPTEVRFFEDLLRCVGHGIIHSGSVSVKRDRLQSFLLEQVRASGTNRIIFIIDDAQRFQSSQYHWLMDVYNELDAQGIGMTNILIGQDELLHQRSALMMSKSFQIVGRFMVHTFHFRGIISPESLKICLLRYDEHSEYPIGSGWSFTRYYFPEAFIDGFRLSNYADEIFEVFYELRKKNGMKLSFDIPMQYITLIVEYILKHFGSNSYNYKINFGKDDWQQAIEYSGYIEAEKYHNGD